MIGASRSGAYQQSDSGHVSIISPQRSATPPLKRTDGLAVSLHMGFHDTSYQRESEHQAPTDDKTLSGCRTQIIARTSVLFGLLAMGSYELAHAETPLSPDAGTTAAMHNKETVMWMTVGASRFAILLADTKAAHEFAAMLPLTIRMADLNSNEKHADLPKSLSANATRPGAIYSGDIMLYGSSTLVVFYKGFNSSYAYTRLGQVKTLADLTQVLGSEDVQIEFSRD